MDTDFATVTVTGRGLVNSAAVFEISQTLFDNGMEPVGLVTGPLSISLFISKSAVQKAAQLLHEKFVGSM